MPLALFVASLLAAPVTSDSCATAAERAAPLKRDGHFVAATEQLLRCVSDECPKVVRELCRAMRADVELQVPTLVLTVQNAERRDLLDASVNLDGKPVTARPGTAIPVDPGVHTLDVSAPGQLEQRLELVVRAGEKLRPVVVTMTQMPTLAPPEELARTHFPLWPALVTSVAAVGGYSAFAGLGLSSRAEVATMRSECAPRCSQARVDGARLKANGADIALAAAVILTGVAVWLWVRYGLD